MSVLGDPQSLFAIGQFRRALALIDELSTRRQLLIDEQIVRTELLSLTGNVESSLRIAEKLHSHRTLSVAQRCRLRDVLGTCTFRKGLFARGIEHYKRGIEAAQSAGELKWECLLRVHLLRNQNHYLGPHHAVADLSLVRRKTYQLADRPISVKFQLVLTELAAKLGLYPRARKHLEAARSLLATVHDRGLHADVKMAELALAAFESNLAEALEYAFELLSMAEETGSQSARFGASTNLGHLLSAQARFDEAIAWIQKGLDENSFGGGNEIALRDTLMSLLMARGQDEDATLQANAIFELLKASVAGDSYYGLWHLLTRVRWLYRTGQADAGVALALDSIPRIERMADRNLLERMKLLAAEGLGRTGRPAQGAHLMAEAVSANPDPPLEIMAEASRIAGRLAAHDDHAAALGHFERAGRILQSVGNLTARA